MAISIKEQVVQGLDVLSETDLWQVADYVTFLRLREKFKSPPVTDDETIAVLYAEFAAEDTALAEEGLQEYGDNLAVEERL